MVSTPRFSTATRAALPTRVRSARVGREIDHQRGQSLDLAGRIQEAGLAVDQHLARRGNVGCDRRQPTGHALEQGARHRLVARHEHRDIGLTEHVRHLCAGMPAGEREAVLDLGVARGLAHRLGQRPVTGDEEEQPRLAAQSQCRSGDEVERTLGVLEVAGVDEGDVLVAPARPAPLTAGWNATRSTPLGTTVIGAPSTSYAARWWWATRTSRVHDAIRASRSSGAVGCRLPLNAPCAVRRVSGDHDWPPLGPRQGVGDMTGERLASDVRRRPVSPAPAHAGRSRSPPAHRRCTPDPCGAARPRRTARHSGGCAHPGTWPRHRPSAGTADSRRRPAARPATRR